MTAALGAIVGAIVTAGLAVITEWYRRKRTAKMAAIILAQERALLAAHVGEEIERLREELGSEGAIDALLGKPARPDSRLIVTSIKDNAK